MPTTTGWFYIATKLSLIFIVYTGIVSVKVAELWDKGLSTDSEVKFVKFLMASFTDPVIMRVQISKLNIVKAEEKYTWYFFFNGKMNKNTMHNFFLF